MKNIDIRAILAEWPFDPARNIRVARFADGRMLLQVRLPMGLEQYEMKGRPDGLKPHGLDSELAFHLRRLDRAKEAGIEPAFRLNHAACEPLFEESTLFYLRYVRFLEMEDWARTLRDTTHNLRLFDLVHQYAESPDDRLYLEQWRPFLIRIHALAGAMVQMSKDRPAKAIHLLQEAVTRIKALPLLNREAFAAETRRSLSELNGLLKRFRDQVPPSPADRLDRELRLAVEAENYERAAELRDQLKALLAPKNKPKPKTESATDR